MSEYHLCMHILCRYHEFVSVSVCKGEGTYVCVGGGMCRCTCACGSGYLCMDVSLAHDFTCQGAHSLLVIYLNT